MVHQSVVISAYTAGYIHKLCIRDEAIYTASTQNYKPVSLVSNYAHTKFLTMLPTFWNSQVTDNPTFVDQYSLTSSFTKVYFHQILMAPLIKVAFLPSESHLHKSVKRSVTWKKIWFGSNDCSSDTTDILFHEHKKHVLCSISQVLESSTNTTVCGGLAAGCWVIKTSAPLLCDGTEFWKRVMRQYLVWNEEKWLSEITKVIY